MPIMLVPRRSYQVAISMPVGAYSWLSVATGVGYGKLFIVPQQTGACCRRGGKFLFLPKSRSLGRWHWFADCWQLLLPPASLLPVWSLLLFCGWSSVSLSVDGGLRSFRLMISSLVWATGSCFLYHSSSSRISLIFSIWRRFSSSYLSFIW